MGIKNKLENAYYEIVAPEKQELIDDANLLDEKIDDSSPLQKAIINLKTKIENSQTWKQREILEKQLKQLEQLETSYKKYISTNLTKKTKEKLSFLFNWIKDQININKEEISDDLEKINKLLEQEKEILEDTIDIINNWTIRDQVENYIDILNIRESISPQKYQDFFDIATIEYINILENRIKRKLNKTEINYILKQKWLLINKTEAKILEEKVASKIPKDYKFKYKIKLFDWNTMELNSKIKTKENQNNIDINELFKQTEKEKKKNKKIVDNISIDNYENLSTNEKMKKIEEILNNQKYEKFLLEVVNKLENKVISTNNNKIKLTKEFLNKHKKELLNNLKVMILMIIHIESDWVYKAKNIEWSSWKWLGQWLDWNWWYSKEYMFNKKWYTKKQLKLKFNKKDLSKFKNRTVWNTNSFETTLKWIYKWYPDNLLNKLDFKIPKKYNKPIELSPIDLDLEQQIQLLILDIGINWKTVKNKLWQSVWIKDFIWTALLWNTWAVKEIYKIFHHTKPNKKTIERIKNISPRYTKKLIKLY